MRISRRVRSLGFGDLQGYSLPPHDSPQVWTEVFAQCVAVPLCTAFTTCSGCGQPGSKRCVYTHLPRASPPTFHSFEGNETDLSAKRAQAEAQARFPCADGDACRPLDSEAPPHEGPQAPFGVVSPHVTPPRLRRAKSAPGKDAGSGNSLGPIDATEDTAWRSFAAVGVDGWCCVRRH